MFNHCKERDVFWAKMIPVVVRYVMNYNSSPTCVDSLTGTFVDILSHMPTISSQGHLKASYWFRIVGQQPTSEAGSYQIWSTRASKQDICLWYLHLCRRTMSRGRWICGEHWKVIWKLLLKPVWNYKKLNLGWRHLKYWNVSFLFL